jgi:threonine synthase
MLAEGKLLCLATSSGNTGSALAAYCAAARISCRIVTVETAPAAKLKQMLAYGAELVRVKGFGVDSAITERAMDCLQRHATAPDAALQISAFRYSPDGMSGVQSISYELAEQAAEGIAHVFCPAGGGGLTLAVARGFAWLLERQRIARSPAIHCVQPSGNDTIAGPLRKGDIRSQAVQCTSHISGLQVPNVIDGNEVIAACRATSGTGHVVEDEHVWDAQRRLAREEGIFCEPAGATALAGVLQAARAGNIGANDTVACLVTGSGFKDAASAERMICGENCKTIHWQQLDESFATHTP